MSAAVCNLASLADALLFYEVGTLQYYKARGAVEADLADQVRMIHGFLGWFISLCLDRPFLQFYVKKKGVKPLFLFISRYSHFYSFCRTYLSTIRH
jgi:hypothetical protein